MVLKRTKYDLTNKKSIFLPHTQVANSKFNWPKELKTQLEFTFTTSNNGMGFCKPIRNQQNNGKFYEHRVG